MKNVVLVTFDSFRADHCGFAGYDRNVTPTLDWMANDGLTFTNAIAPGPSTPEAMPVILTGSHPKALDEQNEVDFTERQAALREHMTVRETIADRFSELGYATAGFSPNPYTSQYFGFDSGFDHYEDFIDGSRERLYEGMLDGVLDKLDLDILFPARVFLNWVQREEVFKPWEDFYDQIIEWVDSVDQPYFIWILLMDTHDPYLVPDDYRTQSRRATYHANWRLWRQGHTPPFSEQTHDRLIRAYDDTIRYSDAFLDRLLDDLSDDSVIAVHGDHGEAFGEHGTYGHHQQLYEENIHVPLVVHGGPTDTIDEPFSLTEMPRLLETLAREEDPTIDPGPVRSRILSGNRAVLRGSEWKYARRSDGDVVYDLAADPAEQEPLDASELYSLCRPLADRWTESDHERERISTAIEQLEGEL